MQQDVRYIRWFEDIKIEDIPRLVVRMPLWERCTVNLPARESKFRMVLR